MKTLIDDEKLQKLHWTHLKKLVGANGAHYDGFENKKEAELYVMEQTEFTEAALKLMIKYGLSEMPDANVDSVAELKAINEAEPEATSEAKPETGVNDAPVPETGYPVATHPPAVEDETAAEPVPETKDEPDADSDIPVFDHNQPHGKISGLCAARFYQNGHHFGGDFRFIPAAEIK